MGNDYLVPSVKTPAKSKKDIISSRLVGHSREEHHRMGIVEDMEVSEGHQPNAAGEVGNEPDQQARWDALVNVCSTLFEQMIEAEKAAAECKLVNSVELPVAQNVTIDEEDDDDDFDDDDFYEDDEEGCLVIDEAPQQIPAPSQVALSNATRATVITSARNTVPLVHTSPVSDPEPQPSTSSGSSRTTSVSGSDTHNGSYSREVPAKSFRRPKHMSQVTFDPSVPFQVPVRYNKNMARKFPGSENRTPEQQAVRERNTLAARQSRAKLRVMDEMLQQEANNEATLNGYVKERLAACFVYANSVRGLLHLDPLDFMQEFELIKAEYVPEPIRAQHQVPRAAGDRGCSESYLLDDSSDDDDDGDDGDYDEQDMSNGDPQPGTSADTTFDRRDY